MMNKEISIELNIFTNCTAVIESHQTIFRTIDSFIEMFGEFPIHIWCDRNPNTNAAPRYIKQLTNKYGSTNVTLTESLSDGYIKAINQSNSDFMFMLEHDWIFKKEIIHHSLGEICEVMSSDLIHQFRFNRVSNKRCFSEPNFSPTFQKETYDYHKGIDVVNSSIVPYFTVKSASNNPHIIHRKLYKQDLFHLLRNVSESYGIEHRLRNIDNAKFAIYGDVDTLATVEHTDGRLNWPTE